MFAIGRTPTQSGCCRWLAVVAVVAVCVGCQSKPNPLLRKHGIDALNDKNLAAAEKRFVQAVEQDPTDWKSLYHLGLIRLQQGMAFDAQILLERALELRHNDAETSDILDALAESLFQRRRMEHLHKLLTQAVTDHGTSRDYLRQGRYMAKLGDVDAAKLAYRKAAYFAAPGDPDPFVKLADFYESIGDTTNAITSLRHAHAIAPGNQRLQHRLREYGIVPGPTAAVPPAK